MYEQIFKSWYQPLKEILNSNYFKKLIKYLDIQYELSKFSFNKIKIYPDKKDVFKCFNCDFRNLKVVFIGTKPFDEMSGGLAFDTKDDTIRLHPVSELFRYKIENEFYDGFHLAHDSSLEYLTKQGVLLLNESLTSSTSKEHENIWNDFIKFVIDIIQDRHTGIIFCMDEKSKYFKYINRKTQYVIGFNDPSGYTHDFNNWKFKFQDINDLIEKNNGKKYVIEF